MKRQLNVLLIDNSPGVTGALKSITHLTSQLDDFLFHYAVPEDGSAAAFLTSSGKRVITVRFIELQKNIKVAAYLPMLLWNSLRLLRFIDQHKIDIVHVNDLYNMTGVVMKMVRPGIRLVYHVRLLRSSYAGPVYPLWVRMIHKFAEKIIAVSDNVARGLPHGGKVRTIYNAIPVPQVGKSESSNQKVSTAHTFTFLYVGNYIEGKGQDFAIEAFAKVVDTMRSVSLVFAGGDLGKEANRRFERKLRTRVEARGLSDKVQFKGFTSDVGKLYASCDVMLNFSVSESFSMTCLEALMHGVPVISSKSGGPEEIIEDNVNGFLVENQNIDAMASAMRLIASDKELLNRFRLGTARAQSRFSIERSAGKLREVYNQLIPGG